MSSAHICIVCQAGDDLQSYEAELKKMDLTYARYGSLKEFLAGGEAQAVSGIIIDLRSLLSMELDERSAMADLEERIPLLHVRRNAVTGEIAGIADGKALEGDTLPTFVNQYCRTAEPRFVRGGSRRALHVDVAIVFQSGMAESRGYLTSTLNVSESGLFVILPVLSPPPMESRALIEFSAVPSIGRFQAEVRWAIAWGASRGKLPGIGVRLIELTEAQRRYLRALVNV